MKKKGERAWKSKALFRPMQSIKGSTKKKEEGWEKTLSWSGILGKLGASILARTSAGRWCFCCRVDLPRKKSAVGRGSGLLPAPPLNGSYKEAKERSLVTILYQPMTSMANKILPAMTNCYPWLFVTSCLDINNLTVASSWRHHHAHILIWLPFAASPHFPQTLMIWVFYITLISCKLPRVVLRWDGRQTN